MLPLFISENWAEQRAKNTGLVRELLMYNSSLTEFFQSASGGVRSIAYGQGYIHFHLFAAA